MIEVVCHRGANAVAPENTYPAAQHCIDWGAEWLEIDVNTSADGIMYVFHGPDLARTTNGQGKIYDWHSSELDKLDCGSWFQTDYADCRMPRLNSFLDWIDHRIKLFLDVKWAPLPELIQLLHQKGYSDETFFWFGREKFAHAFRELNQDLALKINVATTSDINRAIDQYGASIVELDLIENAAELIDYCRGLGIRSMIKFDGSNEAVFQQICQLGPDMVNVDYADTFIKVRDRVTPRAV